jgi:hypothetical protein
MINGMVYGLRLQPQEIKARQRQGKGKAKARQDKTRQDKTREVRLHRDWSSAPILVQPTNIKRTQYTKCRFTEPPEDEQVMLETCRGP